MSDSETSPLPVEHDITLTLVELSRACGIAEQQLVSWVLEGMIVASGQQPKDWRFGEESLRRARLAARLSRDLELNLSGVALALDLLDEIAELKARLRAR